MKYLLTPVTMLLWYLTAYYAIYFTPIAMIFVFSLSWIWLIIGYLFIIGIISAIFGSIPGLLLFFILKLYGINWFSCIAHSLAGLIGCVHIISLFIANPPELVSGSEAIFFLTGMWETAPVKTIFLTPLFGGLTITVLWVTIVSPVIIKLSGEKL